MSTSGSSTVASHERVGTLVPHTPIERELYAMQISRAEQVDPRQVPAGMKSLMAMSVGSYSGEAGAQQMKVTNPVVVAIR